MIVPPNKAIGGISCACIVLFTLIVYLKFNSDSWTTAPSVRTYTPVCLDDPPNFFTQGSPIDAQTALPNAALRLNSRVVDEATNPAPAFNDKFSSDSEAGLAGSSTTSSSSLNSNPKLQPQHSNSRTKPPQRPVELETHVDRGRALNPKVIDDLWTPPNTVEPASYNSEVGNGFGYPNASSDAGIADRMSPSDVATLQELPAACTTDLEDYLRRDSRGDADDAHARRLATSSYGGYPLAEQPAEVAAADETLYNPHAKASQAAFSKAAPTKAAATKAASKGTTGQAKAEDATGADADDEDESKEGPDPHLEIYSRDAFPSARECKTCHEQIFEEWASSSHAYASISPMFHVFEEKVNKLTSGTIGYFCLRCHAPVATTMGLRRDQAIWDGPAVFREGVTCVACHRVKTPYTKADGERRIEPGDIYAPVYGGSDGKGVAIAGKYAGKYKVKTDAHDKGVGQPMHRRSIQFEELSQSSFCMSCHQVAVKPGIKLEVVWDQYRASPACKEGVSCQDCHMGIVPGVDAGYSFGPAAVVAGKVVNPERKHSNHVFYGPGYSIAHPGIFPQTTEADKWSVNQWLSFDWRSDWGKEKYEDDVADGLAGDYFPPAWQDADDRVEAREIITKNLKKLAYKKDLRRQVLENGSKLDGPFFAQRPTAGQRLNFRYCLTNTNPGHNMPSGSLGAQPQLWMNAVLIDPDGQRIWETGYVDSNGDLADNHSLDVLARRIPFDDQLFNLQTKFLTTNVKGTEREMYLPVSFDVDQLPFIRPAPQPVTVINHPPGIRMEGHSIPALGSRNAKFSVPGDLIRRPGVYRLSVRMRSRAEPIYFMRFCDATPEMERMMNEWIADFHVNTVSFEVR